ncbi:protein-disulfide reductase DsbD family protein [Leptospira ilyithenensis]|uniref:Protein-disulfide reductase n=1 Tax=Leptospira ilyithenensis TaxID=2484901 RepID=A0A4R9LUM3_9LEPT|nr:cytochrome c biogenesis protein CcdA [Leptospira ilyithenensis]TGN11129.1 protein-disulfide reductase [Leptospira ilyithenensis]
MISELQLYIESQLAGNGIHPTIFLLLALGGFLASLLPCVYPLYPITAGILGNRQGQNKWIHPLLYYFGLAFIYLLFGVVAGFTGGLFNQFLRFPETNLVLAYLLFILGLSSIEFIQLPFFGKNAVSTQNSCYTGSFLLGMGAGLLSSPCVGPVVVAVLLQIVTASNGSLEILTLVVTSFKMFAFGLGVGLPFLAIGVFGLSLPKSGKWMRYVQWALAIVIFYFSYTYLLKAGAGFGWNETNTLEVFVLWTLLLTAAFFLQNPSDYLPVRMKSALALSSLIIVSISLLVAVSKSKGWSENPSLSESSWEDHENLRWYRTEKKVYDLSRKEKLPIFVDFYADWCTNCKEFQKLSLSDVTLNQTLKNNAILWKIYDTDPVFETFAIDPRFTELKIGLPFFLVLDENGTVLFKTTDYLDTKGMVGAVEGKK